MTISGGYTPAKGVRYSMQYEDTATGWTMVLVATLPGVGSRRVTSPAMTFGELGEWAQAERKRLDAKLSRLFPYPDDNL